MDSFIELAKLRFSFRKYLQKEVSKNVVESVIEAARIAPSATNSQPWRFIVVTKDPLLQQVKDCYSRDWLKLAPVVIIACGDHAISWRRADGKDHCDIDLAIAIDHLTLMAASLGLGTCWICKFDAMKTSEILKLPAHLTPIALIPLGYPAETPSEVGPHFKRKPIGEILSWEGL